MPILEISHRSELLRALQSNQVVIIEYSDPEKDESKSFNRIIKMLSKYADPTILFLRINIKNSNISSELPRTPCIRVYYRGKVIFEQKDFFGKEDMDLYVLRRGIRSVFKTYNIPLRI